MQDSKYKYMFPPKKGDTYPEGGEIFLPGVSSRWLPLVDVGRVSDGALLRDCWFMRVPVNYWTIGTDSFKNTYWVCCRDDGSRKYVIYQTIRENKIVFITCKGECFDTLDEAKNSY